MRRAGSAVERGTAVLLVVALALGAPAGGALAEPATFEAPRLASKAKPKSGRGQGGEGAAAAPGGKSIFAVGQEPDRPRSIFWMPLVSFLLPGFDQWWEGQTTSAALYTGVALGGVAYSRSVQVADNVDTNPKKKEKEDTNTGETSESQEEEEEETALDSKDVALRKYTLGFLVYQGAGGMSAYHAFRTAVRTRKVKGQYDFLKYEETPLDLLAAPFHFKYMTRPTTYIPLGIGAALAYLILSSDLPENYERSSLTSADGFFTSAFSFNAGTHEEAMFRGWLMPVLAEHAMSPFWANATQAGIFALAHISTNPLPLPQLLLGYHLGYVTQERGWRMGEAVFIHVWWDVLAFATLFSYRKKQPDEVARLLPPPVLWLPPLEWRF